MASSSSSPTPPPPSSPITGGAGAAGGACLGALPPELLVAIAEARPDADAAAALAATCRAARDAVAADEQRLWRAYYDARWGIPRGVRAAAAAGGGARSGCAGAATPALPVTAAAGAAAAASPPAAGGSSPPPPPHGTNVDEEGGVDGHADAAWTAAFFRTCAGRWRAAYLHRAAEGCYVCGGPPAAGGGGECDRCLSSREWEVREYEV